MSRVACSSLHSLQFSKIKLNKCNTAKKVVLTGIYHSYTLTIGHTHARHAREMYIMYKL